ncbi:MAG TPA: AraC family transcriptional regulator [Nannocystis exedens]|nr:AraC family transcriptional regulator [Nannocystis exedens]
MPARMVRPKPGIGRGVLNARDGLQKFTVERFHASADLAPLIEHFWTVSWDLGGDPPFVQETLPDPAVHVCFERGRSELVGVCRGKFRRSLEGRGRVIAAKLHPGAWFPFIRGSGQSVAAYTDRRVPLAQVFEGDLAAVEARVFKAEGASAKVGVIEDFLRAQGARADKNVALVRELIDRVARDRTITRVAHLSSRPRALQRLFRRYVGVSPKWVIRRSRLQNAAQALAASAEVDLAGLALELGYADQAHFVRDFREVVGATPGAYARRNSGTD